MERRSLDCMKSEMERSHGICYSVTLLFEKCGFNFQKWILNASRFLRIISLEYKEDIESLSVSSILS